MGLVEWTDYFDALDAALSAGPQGEPWSADVIARGSAAYIAGGDNHARRALDGESAPLEAYE